MSKEVIPDLDYEAIESWETLIFMYKSALKYMETKIAILNDEFQAIHKSLTTFLTKIKLIMQRCDRQHDHGIKRHLFDLFACLIKFFFRQCGVYSGHASEFYFFPESLYSIFFGDS